VALVAKRRFEEIEIRLVLEEIVRLVDGEFDVPVGLLRLLVDRREEEQCIRNVWRSIPDALPSICPRSM